MGKTVRWTGGDRKGERDRDKQKERGREGERSRDEKYRKERWKLRER